MQLYNRGILDFDLARKHSPMEVLPYFHVDIQATRPEKAPKEQPAASRKKDKKTFLVSREAWLDVRTQFWNEHLVHLPLWDFIMYQRLL
jgi:hypothetical protein